MILRDTPFLAAHLSGDTAWVDVLFVPRDQRHQGWGRRIFDQWSHSLPETVKKIQLLAVDLDGGSPLIFWSKLGFEVEGADFPELLTGSYMVKPVRSEKSQPDPTSAA